MAPSVITRFAPSPTGYLHLGHAYSALFAQHAAGTDGRFLLRIEDIDSTRCKPEFMKAIVEDLNWLGLTWEQPVRVQSQHMYDYMTALTKLRQMDLVYPCFCTRRDVEEEAERAGHAPHGPEGVVYAGTCRHLSIQEQQDKMAEHKIANWRLNVKKALALTGPLTWNDRVQGVITAKPQDFGDVVLARKDVPTSYHLSVTVDDHIQGVTLLTRGKDLFRATDIHRLLQELLGFNVPEYHHHDLQLDGSGKRYAKRDKSMTLRTLRDGGCSVEDISRMCGWQQGF